ncbi:unnamed protein product, partial [marine sediment metagenome]
PYVCIGFGATSTRHGTRIDIEFDDFEAHFGGATPLPVAPRPSATPLAVRATDVVLAVGAPDAWDAESVYNPSVLKRGDHYEMWYAADPPQGSWYDSSIGLAYSDDGITWRKYERNPVLVHGGAPCVLYGDWRDGHGPYYKMWYRHFEPSHSRDRGPRKRLGYATSGDGVYWTKHGVIAGKRFEDGFGGGITSPSVVYLPNRPDVPAPYMLYHYDDGDRVRLALSEDGIAWRPHGIVLQPTGPGGWDNFKVADGHVLYVGGKFHMFYAGYGRD